MSIFNMLGGMGNGNGNVMMKAIGAMMRGESPQDFMKNLARTAPELSGLDLDNLEQTANKIAKEKNVDINEAKAKVSQQVKNNL